MIQNAFHFNQEKAYHCSGPHLLVSMSPSTLVYFICLSLLIHVFYASRVSFDAADRVFRIQHLGETENLENITQSSIFIQNGCLYNPEQVLNAKYGKQSFTLPLYTDSENLYCAIILKPVQKTISIEQPFVDIVVYRDDLWTNTHRQKICVTVKFRNQKGGSLLGSCTFDEKDAFVNTCLIRKDIPLSWFDLNRNYSATASATANKFSTTPEDNILNLFYSVGSYCNANQNKALEQKITILSDIDRLQIMPLSAHESGHLSLLSNANQSFAYGLPSPLLLHFRNNHQAKSHALQQISVKVWVDSRTEVVSVIPLCSTEWSLKITPPKSPTFHTTFLLQNVTIQENNKNNFLLGFLVKLKSETNSALASFDDNILTFHWVIQFQFDNGSVSSEDGIVTKFVFTHSTALSVVPVFKDHNLLNTAVISGIQSMITMRIISVLQNGTLRDVTDEAQCISLEPRLLKVSPTCTSVFVDGSELRGSRRVEINIKYKDATTIEFFRVWYPKLPITVWVSDSVLNAINVWQIATWKTLPNKKRHRRNAHQFSCKNRYQQTEVRVLAAFQVVDEATGERTYLTKSHDVMFDVTQLAVGRIQSTDPYIVSLKVINGRLIGIPHRTGSVRFVVKALVPTIDYGSVSVAVVDDQVSAIKLIVQTISEVSMFIRHNPVEISDFALVTHASRYFTQPFEHGNVQIYILYSDGRIEDLANVDTKEYSLSIYSNNEQVLRISQKPNVFNVEIILLKQAFETSLIAELYCPTFCDDVESPPMAVGQSLIYADFENPQIEDRRSVDNSSDVAHIHKTDKAVKDSRFGRLTIIIVLLCLTAFILVFQFFSGNNRFLNNGYEKLILPILTRINSMTPLSDECEVKDTRDWVWISKNQLSMTNSNPSGRNSENPLPKKQHSSTDAFSIGGSTTDTQKSVSVSYRGSEISVYLGRQADVEVNDKMSASVYYESMTRRPMLVHNASLCRSNGYQNHVMDRPYFYTSDPYYYTIDHNSSTHNERNHTKIRDGDSVAYQPWTRTQSKDYDLRHAHARETMA